MPWARQASTPLRLSDDDPRLSSAIEPDTLYAGSGDVHIAYQTVGDGPHLIF